MIGLLMFPWGSWLTTPVLAVDIPECPKVPVPVPFFQSPKQTQKDFRMNMSSHKLQPAKLLVDKS